MSILILKPFFISLITSFVLAYLFYPIYEWLNKRINRKNLTAALVSLLIILIIIIPLGFMIFEVVKESNVGYVVLKQKIATGNLGVDCEKGIICSGIHKLNHWLSNPEVQFYIEDSLKNMTTAFAKGALGFLVSVPKRLLDILITFFIIFFLLRDGEQLVDAIKKSVPLKKSIRDKIFKKSKETVRAVIYGFFVMAVLQGIIGAITFSLFGVTSPLIWGMLIAIFAFIPFIGSFIIWMPAVAFKLLNGHIGAAIGITIGGILMSALDTFVKPKIVGDKAAIHPVIVLLGLLGGLSVFGPVGIIIGPLVLSLLLTLVNVYRKK